MMIKYGFILFWIMAMLSTGVCMAGDAAKEKSALDAAEKWLVVVDRGSYGESWEEAADYLQIAIPQKQWEQALKSVRKPLGKRISRKISGKSFRTTLPGAPDGEYVVIQYETSFENKNSALETVTPMLDKDGVWRVAGYYIK